MSSNECLVQLPVMDVLYHQEAVEACRGAHIRTSGVRSQVAGGRLAAASSPVLACGEVRP